MIGHKALHIYWQPKKFVPVLEMLQELVVILLCLGLFGVMGIKVWELFSSLISPLKVQIVIADILFILILVELFRLLIGYLQNKTISVSVAVEVTIVSILREVIVRGILEIPESEIKAVGEFLLILGGLLLIPMFGKFLDRKSSSSETGRLLSSNIPLDFPQKPDFLGIHSVRETKLN